MSERATFAGGCFWCLEAIFRPLRGVSRVESGYIGGQTPNPTYAQVCSGLTGHAEAIDITFDPGVIAYRTLLELFFAFHDPTTLDRQGPDEGTQYRSAIFAHSLAQEADAVAVIRKLEGEGHFPDPIVTEIVPGGVFYAAEASHQDYFRNNPDKAYCRAMISPKLAKLRAGYAKLLQAP